jgi:hypothetical protein
MSEQIETCGNQEERAVSEQNLTTALDLLDKAEELAAQIEQTEDEERREELDIALFRLLVETSFYCDVRGLLYVCDWCEDETLITGYWLDADGAPGAIGDDDGEGYGIPSSWWEALATGYLRHPEDEQGEVETQLDEQRCTIRALRRCPAAGDDCWRVALPAAA